MDKQRKGFLKKRWVIFGIAIGTVFSVAMATALAVQYATIKDNRFVIDQEWPQPELEVSGKPMEFHVNGGQVVYSNATTVEKDKHYEWKMTLRNIGHAPAVVTVDKLPIVFPQASGVMDRALMKISSSKRGKETDLLVQEIAGASPIDFFSQVPLIVGEGEEIPIVISLDFDRGVASFKKTAIKFDLKFKYTEMRNAN